MVRNCLLPTLNLTTIGTEPLGSKKTTYVTTVGLNFDNLQDRSDTSDFLIARLVQAVHGLKFRPGVIYGIHPEAEPYCQRVAQKLELPCVVYDPRGRGIQFNGEIGGQQGGSLGLIVDTQLIGPEPYEDAAKNIIARGYRVGGLLAMAEFDMPDLAQIRGRLTGDLGFLQVEALVKVSELLGHPDIQLYASADEIIRARRWFDPGRNWGSLK